MIIKLNLSSFFEDERKLGIIEVNPSKDLCVKDVLNKVGTLFNLRIRSKFILGAFIDGYYVPDDHDASIFSSLNNPLIVKKINCPTAKNKERGPKPTSNIEDKSNEKFDSISHNNNSRKNITKEGKSKKEKSSTSLKKRTRNPSSSSENLKDNSLKTESPSKLCDEKSSKKKRKKSSSSSKADSNFCYFDYQLLEKKENDKMEKKENNKSVSNETNSNFDVSIDDKLNQSILDKKTFKKRTRSYSSNSDISLPDNSINKSIVENKEPSDFLLEGKTNKPIYLNCKDIPYFSDSEKMQAPEKFDQETVVNEKCAKGSSSTEDSLLQSEPFKMHKKKRKRRHKKRGKKLKKEMEMEKNKMKKVSENIPFLWEETNRENSKIIFTDVEHDVKPLTSMWDIKEVHNIVENSTPVLDENLAKPNKEILKVINNSERFRVFDEITNLYKEQIGNFSAEFSLLETAAENENLSIYRSGFTKVPKVEKENIAKEVLSQPKNSFKKNLAPPNPVENIYISPNVSREFDSLLNIEASTEVIAFQHGFENYDRIHEIKRISESNNISFTNNKIKCSTPNSNEKSSIYRASLPLRGEKRKKSAPRAFGSMGRILNSLRMKQKNSIFQEEFSDSNEGCDEINSVEVNGNNKHSKDDHCPTLNKGGLGNSKSNYLDDSSKENNKNKDKNETNSSNDEVVHQINVMNYPLISSLPIVGDILAVKLLEIDESLKLTNSSYQVIEITSVENTKVSFVKLKDDCSTSDESNIVVPKVWKRPNEKVQKMTMDWNEIILPRLLFP